MSLEKQALDHSAWILPYSRQRKLASVLTLQGSAFLLARPLNHLKQVTCS